MALPLNLRRRQRRARDDRDGHSSHAGRTRVPSIPTSLRPHHTRLGRRDRGRRRGVLRPRRHRLRRRAQRADLRAEGSARAFGALRLRRAEPLRRVVGGRRGRGDGVPFRWLADPADARAVSAGTRRRGFVAGRRHRRRTRPGNPQGARPGVREPGHLRGSRRGRARQQRARLPDRIGLPARGVGLHADEPASRRREDLLRRPRPGRSGAAARRLPTQGGVGTSRARPWPPLSSDR